MSVAIINDVRHVMCNKVDQKIWSGLISPAHIKRQVDRLRQIPIPCRGPRHYYGLDFIHCRWVCFGQRLGKTRSALCLRHLSRLRLIQCHRKCQVFIHGGAVIVALGKISLTSTTSIPTARPIRILFVVRSTHNLSLASWLHSTPITVACCYYPHRNPCLILHICQCLLLVHL